jgi:hypothetical protein
MPRKRENEEKAMRTGQFTVVVSDDIKDFFNRTAIEGTGGFQSLGRSLKTQLEHGNTLYMDEALFRRVVRYAEHYGDGGFQTRMRKIAIQWLDQNFNKVVKSLVN